MVADDPGLSADGNLQNGGSLSCLHCCLAAFREHVGIFPAFSGRIVSSRATLEGWELFRVREAPYSLG
jgi:hypothetical protein